MIITGLLERGFDYIQKGGWEDFSDAEAELLIQNVCENIENATRYRISNYLLFVVVYLSVFISVFTDSTQLFFYLVCIGLLLLIYGGLFFSKSIVIELFATYIKKYGLAYILSMMKDKEKKKKTLEAIEKLKRDIEIKKQQDT